MRPQSLSIQRLGNPSQPKSSNKRALSPHMQPQVQNTLPHIFLQTGHIQPQPNPTYNPKKHHCKSLTELSEDADGNPYQKRNEHAVKAAKEHLNEIEKILSKSGRTLKDVLLCAVIFDRKRSEKMIMEVLQQKLRQTLGDSGVEKLYKEFPELRHIFKQAHQVPHWKVLMICPQKRKKENKRKKKKER